MSVLTAYDKFIQQALKYGFSLWGTAKTGQTVKYRTGDDGDLEKGYPKSGARFVDNGDGTITDNATGLMWVQDPSQLGGSWGSPGSPSYINWNIAVDLCSSLVYAGYSDWRLPNIKELLSLVDYSKSNPAIDTAFFLNMQNAPYWSSTTRKDSTSYKWQVFFNEGYVDDKYYINEWFARPVRLGIPKD